MDFGEALAILIDGNSIARAGWNGEGMWIELELPEEENCLPYIALTTGEDKVIPWIASHTDLLSLDWFQFSRKIT